MMITIRLAGVFRTGRFNEASREYQVGTCVRKVVDDLCIPEKLLGIVLINSIHADMEAILHEGDTLCLLPLLDGG